VNKYLVPSGTNSEKKIYLSVTKEKKKYDAGVLQINTHQGEFRQFTIPQRIRKVDPLVERRRT
jgi:hypothetical protein